MCEEGKWEPLVDSLVLFCIAANSSSFVCVRFAAFQSLITVIAETFPINQTVLSKGGRKPKHGSHFLSYFLMQILSLSQYHVISMQDMKVSMYQG